MFQQADLPHSGGRFRPVAVPVVDGRVEFYADVTWNGFIIYDVGRAVYHGAHLAVRDDEAFALYYDYMTLLVLAGSDPTSRSREPVRLSEVIRTATRTDGADQRVHLNNVVSEINTAASGLAELNRSILVTPA